MKRDLTIRALNMATALRPPPEGCIDHTDRGSQYCPNEYQICLAKHGFKVSMSDNENCYDNSKVEAFLKTLKAELIWRNRWATLVKQKVRYSNTSMGSITRADVIHRWVAKAPWLSSERPHK